MRLLLCGAAFAFVDAGGLLLFLHNTIQRNQRTRSMLGTILLVILILILLSAIPAWPHSRNWGYGPSGGLGLLVVIVLVLVLFKVF